MLVHVFHGDGGQVHALGAGAVAALLDVAQQLAALDDVAPVVAAGVGHSQHHLGVRCQRLQRVQGGAGQMAHTKHHDPPRHAAGQRPGACPQALDDLAVQAGAQHGVLLGCQVVQQGAPQQGLPALVGGHGGFGLAGVDQHLAPLCPGLQPVDAVVLVLVEQVGQPGGQLQRAVGPLPLQVAPHGGEGLLRRRPFQQAGQEAHQAPGLGPLVQRRDARHRLRAQHLPIGAPQKAPRQLHPGGGAHARLAGQLHLEPLGHAIALHEHDFFFERVQRVLAQPGDDGLGQRFGLVAVQGDPAGGNGRQGGGGTGQGHLVVGPKGGEGLHRRGKGRRILSWRRSNPAPCAKNKVLRHPAQ